MKTLLTTLSIIISLTSYSQSVSEVIRTNTVIEEGYDEGRYYVLVDGDDLFDYYAYYFENPNHNCNLLIGIMNNNKVLNFIKYLNANHPRVDDLTWIDSSNMIKITIIIEEFTQILFEDI
jgi:hypothetical protein